MELITRITPSKEDVEILINNYFSEEILEKRISFEKYLELLSNYVKKNSDEPIKYFGENVIGYSKSTKDERYLIKQPQHQRYVTWSFANESGGAKINFPSSIYLIRVELYRIVNIEAYMYLSWNELDTVLYKYGMPNMLGGNSICIGSAKREEKENIITALEEIIYSPYSHSDLNNVKGFKGTKEYFEYLSTNTIQKKYLYVANIKIRDLISGKEGI